MRSIGLPVVEAMPDESLLAAMCDGDGDATVAFIRRFQGRVYSVAVAVLGDSGLAEDVAQQAFERAWRHGTTFDPRRGGVGTWLATITRNLAIDVMRTHRPVPVDPSELLILCSSGRGPEDRAVAGAAGDRVRCALRALPAEQGRAVVMAGLGGMSASEVAAAEGIPLGTAKTRIRTAMGRLRQALEPLRDSRG